MGSDSSRWLCATQAFRSYWFSIAQLLLDGRRTDDYISSRQSIQRTWRDIMISANREKPVVGFAAFGPAQQPNVPSTPAGVVDAMAAERERNIRAEREAIDARSRVEAAGPTLLEAAKLARDFIQADRDQLQKVLSAAPGDDDGFDEETIEGLAEYDNVLGPLKTAIAAATEVWVSWKGGDAPVASDTVVVVRTRDGHVGEVPAAASCFSWAHEGELDDIVAYMVAAPAAVEAS